MILLFPTFGMPPINIQLPTVLNFGGARVYRLVISFLMFSLVAAENGITTSPWALISFIKLLV